MVAWVLLAVGALLLTVLVVCLGALALAGAGGFDRLLAGSVLAVAYVALVVLGLAAAGWLGRATLLAGLAVGAVAAAVAVRVRGCPWRLPVRPAVSLATAPLLAVAGVAVALAVVAAYYLPVWQWDALGYHLPYVNLLLQNGTLADVPADVPYVSTYPHTVEWVFTAWRALLPDDGLVELAHLPFGLLGAAAIAAIAREQDARPDHAVAAGAAWLTLPAVFLQLPTNYTDVASAALALAAIAFVLTARDRSRILLAAVAIGLFLGSKPQAPPAAALLLVVLTVLGWRAGHRAAAVAAWPIALLLGAHSYLANVVRHGNPVWPVRVEIGPLTLPGPQPMSGLLNSGAAAPRTHGNVVSRVAESWSTIQPPLPVFDMRIGGLGLLFLIALPFAVFTAVRGRSVALAVCAVATLVTPEPAVARYVLAFAGLTLALAAPVLRRAGTLGQRIVLGVLTVIAASNLVIAFPGLTGEGPPLRDYPGMSPAERLRAVGASGPPLDYLDAQARLQPGQVTVVDGGAELPYLAWPPDLSHRAVFVPGDATAAEVEAIVTAPEAGLLIVGDDTAAGRAARRHPELYEPVFRCRSAPCTGYLRR